MPPVCQHCNEVGHRLKHCRAAPILCKLCNSRSHSEEKCPMAISKKNPSTSRRERERSRECHEKSNPTTGGSTKSLVINFVESSLGKSAGLDQGEGSSLAGSGKAQSQNHIPSNVLEKTAVSQSSPGVESDSSDVQSPRSPEAKSPLSSDNSMGFTEVSTRKKKKKNKRGKGPKSQ